MVRYAIAAALLVGILFGLCALSPERLVALVLRSALRDLGEHGVRVELLRVRPSSAELKIDVPSAGVHLLAEPTFQVRRLFPLRFRVEWQSDIPGYALAARVDYVLFRGWRLKGSLASRAHSRPVRLELDGRTRHRGEEVLGELAVSGHYGAIAIDGDAELTVDDDTEGFHGDLRWHSRDRQVALETFVARWQLQHAGRLTTAALTLEPKAFRSPYLVLEKDAILRWRDEGGMRVLSAEIPLCHSPLLDAPAWLVDPKLRGNFEVRLREADPVLRFDGQVGDAERVFTASLRGTADPATGAIDMQAELPLDLEHFQPEDWFPALDSLENLSGRLDARASLRWRAATGARLEVGLRANNVAGTWSGTPFGGLALQTRAHVLPKLIGIGEGHLRLQSFGARRILRDVDVRWDLPSARLLELKSIAGKFSGGELSAPAAEVQFVPSLQTSLDLRLTGASLRELLDTVGLATLSGEGKLSGALPIAWREGSLVIRRGLLANDGPGILRYRDGTLTGVGERIETLDEFTDLLNRGQQALAFKALDDFHYRVLRFGLDRDPAHGLAIDLYLKGSNPNLAKGQLFEINLPITGDVESLLVQSLLKSMMEDKAWQDRIHEIYRQRRRSRSR